MKSTNASGVGFILLTVFFTVSGQLLLKKGMMKIGSFGSGAEGWTAHLIQALSNPLVVLGLACAGAAALTWMAAVSRADLSFAYPFMSLAIVLTLALTPLLLGERVQIHQWLGVALVILGVWIGARS
ncbi:EamA family transporter [Horticoccus luteus]|uniref:EamA family transporter n=1 Tax=Horticoccus luteus TaxID=2862869 RepID=A0A8F9TVA5_9BACT|nr:EamA family transporter [Horticoccus luteus]QYM79771.1 EamA family transporter [Horticoccus luteus]